MNRKPDFLVIGAMKCGTSTVCAYLEDHPQVFMVPSLDPNYFSHPERAALGPKWYMSLYDGYKDELVVGEGSNDYSAGEMYPGTARRIAEFNPDFKIIYIVRHPIKRMISAWVQNRADKGDEVPARLDEAALQLPERYIDQSLYWKNISIYLDLFDRRQVFVGFMEDMIQDQALFFRGITGFLGIEERSVAERKHMNPSRGKRIPTPAYSFVNGLSVTRVLKKAVPATLRKSVKRHVLSQRIEALPQFSPRVHRMVLEIVRPDAERFLAEFERPAHFWAWHEVQR